jgi:hypothetical protein
MGMTKKYTRHIHVKMTDDLYDKAVKLAGVCCEGKISQLVRKLIEEKYEETFGKKSGDKA